ncbi:uncharacterized protein F5Z01DRAFT_661988 [Emericellopsis atlantica]|uniref:Uncharacterized protein n=1 Tax=Emericellopsis atlantica TaxID=2614577 RepID=A0A9P8CM53_9HYPO|nr:uncharacterized protein F5Z01DRAFT_661988 [Emericellopsis atlantica]KAG9252103.1 hypothetical protein F5Z01DRAFT_661988 [Emericellopsis atlantica]
MSPPGPSTPTPRRFLLSKRNQQQSTAGFQSTPRFQAPSSSARAAPATSVQRPPSTASAVHDARNVAPLKLALPQGKQRGVEDVDDEDERVEVSSVEQSERDEVEEDAIEASSSPRSHVEEPGNARMEDDDLDGSDPDDGRVDDVTRSDAVSEEGDDDDNDEASSSSPSMERDTKRRKLSITPLPAFSPPSIQQQDEATSTDSDLNENQEPSSGAESSSSAGSPSRRDAQQPTFRRVPRFKPLDPDLATPGLPAAFSPQRRGARYLTGGLAAEVQSMLSAIKSEDQELATSSSCTTIRVEEVRAGRRMYLVRDEHGRRIVLAGEGKLTGLGRRAPVAQGSVVDVGRLGWSVDMEGERWEVHCDWSMVV